MQCMDISIIIEMCWPGDNKKVLSKKESKIESKDSGEELKHNYEAN